MKIKRKDLQRLIENYLFEKIQIPSKVKAKGYTYELPGDGVVKITAKGTTPKNIVILPKDMTEFDGKPITRSMKRNKKYYEGIKGDIVSAEKKAEEYFSKKEDLPKKEEPLEDSESRESKNAKKFTENINKGLTEFLSSLLYYMDKKFKFSKNAIKVLTGGDSMIKSQNISYGNDTRRLIKNPFFGAEVEPTSKQKDAYKRLLQNLSSMIYGGDLNNLNLDITIAPEIETILNSKPEGLLYIMRIGLGRLDTVGDSLELGDAGEKFKDLEEFAEMFLASSFFLPQNLK